MDSILNFQKIYIESGEIKSYEYNEYQPTSGSNLNIPGNINIHIENQDELYHPRRSYLLVEGNLVKEDGTRYAAADLVALANGVVHLFSNVKYELAGQEIESVNNQGIAGVLMGIAKYPYEYAYGAGLIQCWSPETSDGVLMERGFARRKEYIIANSDPHGSFSFAIALENLFGFCEDYDKVLYGMRRKLILVGKSNDEAIFKVAAVAKGKVESAAWVMPRVHPNDVKILVCTKPLQQRLPGMPHFGCANVVLPRYPLKLGPLTGGWASAPHRKTRDMFRSRCSLTGRVIMIITRPCSTICPQRKLV